MHNYVSNSYQANMAYKPLPHSSILSKAMLRQILYKSVQKVEHSVTAMIRHLCHKINTLSCHGCLITSCEDKMNMAQ